MLAGLQASISLLCSMQAESCQSALKRGDALQMIFHSKTIGSILLIDMAALLMYNVAGMCVTGERCLTNIVPSLASNAVLRYSTSPTVALTAVLLWQVTWAPSSGRF